MSMKQPDTEAANTFVSLLAFSFIITFASFTERSESATKKKKRKGAKTV